MKQLSNNLFLVAVAIVAAFSCAKPLEWTDPEGVYKDSELVTIPFHINVSNKTKVTELQEEAESNIVRWTVFAFDDQDGWTRYASADDGGVINLKLWTGRQYSCYAFANYNTFGTSAFVPSTIHEREALLNRVVTLSDNTADKLMMFGSKTVVPKGRPESVQDGEDEREVTVYDDVEISAVRLVSRIDVPEIHIDFSDAQKEPGKCLLRGIYVTNAYTTNRLASDYRPNELSDTRSAWYNSGGLHVGENSVEALDAILVEDDMKVSLSREHPFLQPVSFYAFPNSTHSEDDEWQFYRWTRRCTRVVVKLQLDSEYYYYQMDIPEMRRNRVYRFSDIVIKDFGGSTEESGRVPAGAIEYNLDEYPFGYVFTDNKEELDY